MKVLLTGVTGIVGQYLLPFLNDNPDITEIIGISRDAQYYYGSHPQKNKVKYLQCESRLEKKEWVYRLISEVKPNIIVNLAAVSTSSSPAFDVWKNTNITLNLLECCKQCDCNIRFIQASSMTIDNYPQSVYSASKFACEKLVESYSQLYPKIRGLNIRFPAIVGRGNKHGLLADIVNKLKSDSEQIILFGKQPGSCKPYIYAKNLAYIINKIMLDNKWYNNEHDGYYEPMIISPPNSITVETVANITMNILNINKNINWDENKVWVGDQSFVQSDPWFVNNYCPSEIMNSETAIRFAVKDIINGK